MSTLLKKCDHLKNSKKKLFKEMVARVEPNESSVPAQDGNYEYWREYKKNLKYCRHLRRNIFTKKIEVYCDENHLAKGHDYFSLSTMSLSSDDNKLALATDTDGSENYTFTFLNLTTRKKLTDSLKMCSGDCAWSKDNKTFYYVVQDQNLRPYRVYRHELGTPQTKDVLLFEEKDPQYFVGISTSQSKDFIYLQTANKVTSEVWYLRTTEPLGAFQLIQKRQDGVEYQISDRHEVFWMITNQKALNFKIMTAPVLLKNGKRIWTEYIQHSPETLREGLLLFSDFAVISERTKGLPQIRVINLKNQKNKIIDFPDAAYDVSIASANYEFLTNNLRLAYSSPITPPSTLNFDMISGKLTNLKTKLVRGHSASKYVCDRVWVKSHDGVQVPMTLVYKKDLKQLQPGYLYGYGSYGANMPDGFPARRDIYRLIDRGFVYALAHIRGGSEMGRHWYENGKFLKKKNTFLDFIACAEYLIQKKIVKQNGLSICGGSAGGMLVGACMNMRPELFHCVAAHVPFVDVLNTMLNKDLLLTQIEYKEWGNPDDKKYYKYIKSYSPYDNITPQHYPHLFVTAGLNDPRVTYWEPAKWVAQLRKLKLDKKPILFKINMGAGHFGVSGRFDHLWEMAEEYAFILDRMGIRE